MIWRFIPYQVYDPYWNMAIDEAILIAHHENRVLPTLRLYGWNPATLSIGYFQHAHRQINHEKIEELNLGFVRRMTGGRAVFHDRELTYSVILSEKNPLVSSSVQATYRKINLALETAIKKLTLKVDESVQKIQSETSSAACFDAPGSEEFLIDGRKAIGSAQTRQQGVLLQHGSILLDFDFKTFYDIFTFPTKQSRLQFETRIGTLTQLCNRPIPMEEAMKAVYSGFEEGLSVSLVEQNLSPYEWELAEQLVKDKYSKTEWNEKR
ncbi:lipoate--protein ligase family protein [Shimazuella alba]|uniref:Octanoyltransferase n=1 Tax=Shimazuella alba TaxID=2690964 RepID=A0A6I4VWU4_9BACL|nr:biotin/lipoate A/B protein ligase family protein [Shimazuella alba]MXQ55101.1 octanoyltransferase [Shimazuella alba]